MKGLLVIVEMDGAGDALAGWWVSERGADAVTLRTSLASAHNSWMVLVELVSKMTVVRSCEFSPGGREEASYSPWAVVIRNGEWVATSQ